ncbi:MAG TPA: alpha/beta hydrolase, partial [Reyranellaceae bacterium]|nr:alpha/beta hydrolase [Reyranellaceae bacterium]
LAAADDPWIPGALYRAVDWRKNPGLLPLLSDAGGHVGFHCAGALEPWSDLAVARFISGVSPAA